MPLTLEQYDNMPADMKARLDANLEAAKARVVSDRNREALRRLDPLIAIAVEYAARDMLIDALTWKELHPNKRYYWAHNEELARRIIDNLEYGPALVRRAEGEAKSRAERLRESAALWGNKHLLEPLA